MRFVKLLLELFMKLETFESELGNVWKLRWRPLKTVLPLRRINGRPRMKFIYRVLMILISC